jgi:hypothetical protein
MEEGVFVSFSDVCRVGYKPDRLGGGLISDTGASYVAKLALQHHAFATPPLAGNAYCIAALVGLRPRYSGHTDSDAGLRAIKRSTRHRFRNFGADSPKLIDQFFI